MGWRVYTLPGDVYRVNTSGQLGVFGRARAVVCPAKQDIITNKRGTRETGHHSKSEDAIHREKERE